MDRNTNPYDFPFLDAAAKDGKAMAAAIEASGMTYANCRALVRSTGGLVAKLGSRRRYAALDRFLQSFLDRAKEG